MTDLSIEAEPPKKLVSVTLMEYVIDASCDRGMLTVEEELSKLFLRYCWIDVPGMESKLVVTFQATLVQGRPPLPVVADKSSFKSAHPPICVGMIMMMEGTNWVVGGATVTVVALVAKFNWQRGTPGTAQVARNRPPRIVKGCPGDK